MDEGVPEEQDDDDDEEEDDEDDDNVIDEVCTNCSGFCTTIQKR